MSLLLLFNAQTDVLISGTAGVGLAGSMTIRVFAGCGAIGRAGSMLRENLFKTAQGSTGRASTATYLDETGIMRLAGVDVARIDHNPAPPYRSFDLLLEAASTNFIPNANTVSVGTLSVSSTDIPRLYVDATLWKVTSNGAGMPAYYIGVPITPNVAYTASMWVYIPSGYAGGVLRVDFDTTGPNNLGMTPWGGSIRLADLSKTNQWQRIAFNCISSSNSMNIVMRTNTTDIAGQVFYTTCWQVEPGLVPTSYIPTTGIVGTRAADIGFARETPATYFDASGTMQTAAINEFRITHDTSGKLLGPLIEGTKTNYARNPFALGGVLGAMDSGGVMPPCWNQANSIGCVWTLIGTGSTFGIPTLRMRCQGVSTAANNAAIYFEYPVGIAGLGYSTTISQSFWLALVDGSFTNISSINHFIPCFPATGSAVTDLRNPLTAPVTTTLTRFEMQSTTPSSGLAPFSYWMHAVLFYTNTIGVNVDFTIDIGGPQVELAPRSSNIYPASSDITARTRRAADFTGNVIVLDTVATVNQGPTASMTGVMAIGKTNIDTSDFEFNFLAGLDQRITYSRNSIATDSFYTDTPGSSYNVYAINQPRFSSKGLLIEDSRINYLLNSDAPATQTTVALPGAARQFLLWVIGTGSAAVDPVTAVGTAFGTATAGNPVNFTINTTGTVIVTVTGSLTRFQLEGVNVGGIFTRTPTSYIPTTNAIGTRGSDFVSLPTGTWYNPIASSFAAEAIMPVFANSMLNTLVSLNDGTVNNHFDVYLQPGTTAVRSGDYYGTNTVDLFISGNPVTPGVLFKLAASYTNGAAAMVLDGGTPITGVPAHWPGATFNTITIGSQQVNQFYLNGYISRLRYWGRTLSNTELKQVTTPDASAITVENDGRITGVMGTGKASITTEALELNFLAGVDPRLTFSRSSIATDSLYTDASGSSYNVFAINQPRLSLNGLLTEDNRTNFVLNSDAPATQTVGLLGGGRQFLLWVIGTGSATVAAGTAVGSAFGTATAGVPVNFTITTGGTVVVTVTGSLTRFQLEGINTGGTFARSPTSYIPTTNVAATRSNDVVSMPTGAWYSPTVSSFAVEAMSPTSSNSQILTLVSLNDGTLNNRFDLYFQAGTLNTHGGDFYSNNTADGGTTTAGATAGVPFKLAATFTNGPVSSVIDGGVPNVGNPAAHWPGASLNQLYIGATGTFLYYFNGYISRVRYWNRTLSATELKQVTTQDVSTISVNVGNIVGVSGLGQPGSIIDQNVEQVIGTSATGQTVSTPFGIALDWNFTTGVMPPGITFTRSTTATDGQYTDAPGSTYNTYAINQPRFLSGPNGGIIMENWGRTQILLNSTAPATQTVSLTTTVLALHVLWVIGTGSATITAGTGTATGLGTATGGNPLFFTVTLAGTFTVTVTGSLNRFQLEKGGSPSTFIPSAGVAVARTQDQMSMPVGAWYNAAAGTLLAETVYPFFNGLNTNFCGQVELDDGTANNYIRLTNQPNPQVLVVTGGVSQSNRTIVLPPQSGQIYRLAARYSSTDVRGCSQGILFVAETIFALPTGMNQLLSTIQAANNQGTLQYLRRIQYFPFPMSDVDLVAATTYPLPQGLLTVIAQDIKPVIGVFGLGQVGIVSEQPAEILLGVNGTGQQGLVVVQDVKPVTGISGSGQVGIVSEQPAEILLGRSAIGQQGSVIAQNFEPVISVTASAQVGNLSEQPTELLLGCSATGRTISTSYGVTIDWDFTTGVMPPGAIFTRSTTATDGLYTDAPGSTYNTYAIDQPRFWPGGGGIMVENWARINSLLNSTTPATQTVTLTSSGVMVFVLWVIGTGSATITAGTGAATGLGTATPGNPLYFTLTVVGTFTVTVNGSLDRFQLERGGTPGSFIPTTATNPQRFWDTITLPIGNWFNPAEGTLIAESMFPVLGAGMVAAAAQARLDDGTTSNVFVISVTPNYQFYVITGTVSQMNRTNVQAPVSNQIFRIGARYIAANGSGRACGNGTLFVEDTGKTLPPITQLTVPSQAANIQGVIQQIRRIQYFPYAMSDTALVSAATYPPSQGSITVTIQNTEPLFGVGCFGQIGSLSFVQQKSVLPIGVRGTAQPGVIIDQNIESAVGVSGTGQQYSLLSRGSNAAYFDAALNFIEVGPDVSRYGYDFNTGTYVGLLVENTVTNLICNSRAENNVPNTLPTFWGQFATNGLTITYTGPGKLNGMPYIDMRFAGTTTGAFLVYVFDNTLLGVVNPGDLVTHSFFCQLVGGSLTNITSVNMECRFNPSPIRDTSFTPTTTLRRYVTTYTAVAGITGVYPGFSFNFNVGVAIDLTLRFALPQTEIAASVSSPILNVPGVRNQNPTRAADVVVPFVQVSSTIPSSGPSLDISLAGPTLDPRIIYTRAGTATDAMWTDAINRSTYNAFAANTPRFSAGGLFVEDTRTNYLLNSETPVTQTTGSLPLGRYVLWVIGTGSATVAVGTAVIDVPYPSSTATHGSPIQFAVTTSGTMVVTVTGSLLRFQLEGVGAGVIAPTSYIPTTGTTASRNTDNATLALPAPWFNPNEFTWIVETETLPTPFGNSGNAISAFRIDDGTNNNRIQSGFIGNNPNNTYSVAVLGNVNQNITDTTVLSANLRTRMGMSVGAGQFNSCFNGLIPYSKAMTVPTGLNRIGFSVTGSTVVPSVGKRYHLTIWPRALSANELQQQFVLLSRNSNATYFDFALNFIEVGPNVSRYGYDFNTGAYLGLLVENAAINFICNPRGENNVPNTVPTNWVAQAGAGLTITHIGPVTLNGIPYVDIRFVGTTNGTYMVYVFDNTSPVPFNVGDLITLSFYCQLVGGSLTNITSMNLTYRFNTIPINSSFTPTSTLQRYATTATVPIGATTVQTGFQFSCNSGVAIDITLRFALPQTEFGASASSPILNVPGVRNLAPTRAADVQGSAPTFSANAVGQVGTVSEQSTELLLGVGGMAQLGSVIVQNIKPTSGVYTTGLVGFVSFFQQKLAVPVGVGVTGQPGSITVSVQNIEPIIGISGSGQVGNVSRQLSELLLGVAGAGQFGNVVANDQITIALPFYRTTSASYIDDNGALQTVGPNVARYQSGALLLEPVATNLCTFPTIGGTGWTNTNATVVTNDASVLAPDGSHTASYLQDNAVNTQHYTSIATSSLVTNNVYTHSVFARISTNKYLCIYFDTTTYAVFDLSFGTIPTKIGVTATISQLGPTSWYRCSITATKKLTHNSLLFLPSSTYLAYVGNLTGIELWGLQTETGSVATSYTPTNRDADTTTASYGRPGSITEEIDIGTSGIASSGQVGNVSGLPIEVLLGLSAAGQMGTTIAQSFQSLTNVTGLGQANIVATAKGGGLTASGVFGASQTGSLTTSIQDVRASGTLATGQVGSAINQPAKILIGNSGIGQQGSLIVQAVTSVIGAPGIGQSGNAISTIIPVTSGVTAIGKTGNVSAIDTACITVGVSSAGQSGLVVDTISSTTTIAGVAASAQIGLISFRSGSDIAVFGTSTTGQAGIATDYQVTNVLTSTGIGQVGHSIDQIGALVQLPIVPTGQAGSVTTKVDDSYVISGAIATGQAGLASSQIDQPKTILGKLAIGQAGTMAIQSDNIQQCQGAVVIGLAGSVLTTVDDTGAISGNFATGQMGSMVTSASRLLSSNAAIGLVGTTRTIHVAPVPSIAATGIVGTISLSIFSIGGNSTITAPSVSVNGQVGSVASKLDQVKATLAGAVAQGSPGLVTPNVGFVPGARVATGQAGSILIQTDSNVTPHGVSAIGAANSIPRATLLIGNSAYGNCNSPIAIVSSLLTGQFATGAIGSLRMLSIPITGRSGVGMAGSMHTSRLFGALISGNVTGGDAGNMHTTAVVRKKIAIPVYVMVY